MDITTQERTNILKLTVGLFNAAPGANYLSEFTSVFEANGHNLAALAGTLGTTGAFQSLYPNFQTASEFATKFLTTLGLQGNTEAVDFVTAKFNAGVPKAQIIYDALVALDASTSAEFAAAKAILANKAAVAENYSVTLGASSTSLETLQGALANVTADPASVTAANAANAGGNGQTFTLTSGADNIVGTAGNDTIKAVIDAQDAALGATSAKITTLNATDDIAGGAGTDSLSIIANGNAANSVTPLFLTGVEKVSVKDVDNTGANGTTLNLVNATGVTEVINDGSVAAIAFQNIGTAAVTVKNVTTAVGTTFTRGTSAVTADLTVNLENVGKAVTAADASGAVATQMAALSSLSANNQSTKATINATGYVNVLSAELSGNAGAGHTVDTLTVNAAGTTIFGASGGAVDITGFDTTKAAKIVVTGAGNVSLNTLAAVVQTVDASASTGNVTLQGTQYNTGTNAAALAAPGLKLTGGSGNDSFTFDGVATAVVDMGAGNDTAIVNAGLTAGASIKGGEGTDTVQLAVADINALEAQTAAGTALRATISGFEKLGVTGDLTGAINAAHAGGYNYVVLNGAVDNADAGPVADESVNITGLTTGATVEFRALGVYEDIAQVVMTDAALSTTDVLNIALNANLAAAANNNSQVTAKVGVAGINTINVTANDLVNDVTDDDLTAAADVADNGAGDGYTLVLSNTANVNTINVAGSSFVNYTMSAGTDAATLLDASASTGNFTTSVAAFAGTQRIEVKGSQGVNDITGSGLAFGEKITGGAKGDSITGGVGADDMTGNGGRDYFIQGASASGLTAATVDQISDFGKVTVAATAAEVSGMTNIGTFQDSATARGGDNADIVDFTAVAGTAVGSAKSSADDAAINVALEALDLSDATQFAGKVINASIAKGVLTVGGADAAMVDTLAEWVAVANVAAETAGETVAFQFNSNTYLFQQQAAGDELVELTGVTGVTGVVLVGSAVAAAVGDIFVL